MIVLQTLGIPFYFQKVLGEGTQKDSPESSLGSPFSHLERSPCLLRGKNLHNFSLPFHRQADCVPQRLLLYHILWASHSVYGVPTKNHWAYPLVFSFSRFQFSLRMLIFSCSALAIGRDWRRSSAFIFTFATWWTTALWRGSMTLLSLSASLIPSGRSMRTSLTKWLHFLRRLKFILVNLCN